MQNYINTLTIWIPNTWIPDSMGVRYSNGQVMWLGRPFEHHFFSPDSRPPFKYQTIWQPDTNLPFEYQTSPVFRCFTVSVQFPSIFGGRIQLVRLLLGTIWLVKALSCLFYIKLTSVLQCGSENWMCQDFEWSKVGWLTNCTVFKWSTISKLDILVRFLMALLA